MSAGSTINVFLSYRREDTRHAAGRLGDRLNSRFGKVFMDIDNIDPGVDFTTVIRQAVGECDILVALIGDKWISVEDQRGRRRLEDPDDWIVQEIRVALDRGIRVIPVLVDGARMPGRQDMPDVLAPLANRQAVSLRHESFASDSQRLIAAMEKMLDVRIKPSDALDAGRVQGSGTIKPERVDPASDPDYASAVEALSGQRWERAIDALSGLLDRYPGDPGLTGELDHARRQKQRADDDDAQRAAAAERLAGVVRPTDQVVESDPGDRDAGVSLVKAKTQERIAELQAEVRSMHRAGRWERVVAAGEELSTLDPGGADPVGLVRDARARLVEAGLARRYEAGKSQLEQGALAQAVTTFNDLLRDRPGYRNAAALLARARVRMGVAKRPVAGSPVAGSPVAGSPVAGSSVPVPRILQVRDWVLSVAFSRDGSRLAAGSRRRLGVWNLRTGALLWDGEFGGWNLNVLAVAFSPDGRRLAVGTSDRTAWVLDAVTGDVHLNLVHGGVVHSVAFSPDGRRLATGSADEAARIWEAAGGAERVRVVHAGVVHSVAFSPDGRRLATGSADKTARIWDAVSGAERVRFAPGSGVQSVALNPGGDRLVTCGADDIVWDALTGRQLLKIPRRSVSVAFSPDGGRIATGGVDNTARIWDVGSGAESLSLRHDGIVNSVAFSPDGSRLATGSDDKTARIWDVTPDPERGSS